MIECCSSVGPSPTCAAPSNPRATSTPSVFMPSPSRRSVACGAGELGQVGGARAAGLDAPGLDAHVPVAGLGAQRTDGALLARDDREWVVLEDPHRVLVRDLVDRRSSAEP